MYLYQYIFNANFGKMYAISGCICKFSFEVSFSNYL